MLRINLIVLGILGLVHTSFAQTVGFGSTGNTPSIMKCDLTKEIAPSAQMQKVTQGQGKTYACAYERKYFEVALVGVDLGLKAAKAAGSKLIVSIQCTTGDPTGMYLYGGRPVGFQTSSFQDSPWFYNPNPKSPGGRCFVVGDQVLMKQLKAETNESVMIALPRALLQ